MSAGVVSLRFDTQYKSPVPIHDHLQILFNSIYTNLGKLFYFSEPIPFSVKWANNTTALPWDFGDDKESQ